MNAARQEGDRLVIEANGTLIVADAIRLASVRTIRRVGGGSDSGGHEEQRDAEEEEEE